MDFDLEAEFRQRWSAEGLGKRVTVRAAEFPRCTRHDKPIVELATIDRREVELRPILFHEQLDPDRPGFVRYDFCSSPRTTDRESNPESNSTARDGTEPDVTE